MGRRVEYSFHHRPVRRSMGGHTYYLQDHFKRRKDAEKYAEGFRKQGRLARIIKYRGEYEVFTTMKHGEFRRR